MTKQEIEDQIAKLQSELATAPDAQPPAAPAATTTAEAPDPSNMPVSDKEVAVDTAIQTAGAVAGKFIHSPAAVSAVAAATGMAPAFVHLGLFFASLFHHHATTQGFVQQ